MSDGIPSPLVVTMGEPAGIGGEMLLKAWDKHRQIMPPLIAVDDRDRLQTLIKTLKLDIELIEYQVSSPVTSNSSYKLPVLHTPLAKKQKPGILVKENADAVIASITKAVELTRAGFTAGIVTNPIQKSALYDAGFQFPGHTEFLASLSGPNTIPVMMLACEQLRVIPVTVHVSLQDALTSLTTKKIVEQTEITAQALRSDFGIANPRIAIAGLNPHAGEDGSMGTEEQLIIKPAIDALIQSGLSVSGPHPPDTLFSAQSRPSYDAAICMYHDQALIPIKTLDFDGAVNVTLGLDFIRTSPDHGTALDIAGTGQASERSLVAAIHMADQMSRLRLKNRDKANA